MATLAPTAPDTESLSEAPAVRLSGIRRVYGDVVAVAGIDLDIAAGEFFTMLGPSGSGKTTTLRVIAGFERPDAGRVELRGVDVTRVAPSQRAVNTVFQDYALFPHMTVAENVEYGLRVKGMSRPDRRARKSAPTWSAFSAKPGAVSSSNTASAAAHATGLPPNVPPSPPT